MTGWRSILFVPASRADLATKAHRYAPGAVVLDLEDAVPAHEKSDARAALAETVDAVGDGVEVLVRVNAPGSTWFADDVTSLPRGIAGVVVPKYEGPVDVEFPVVAGIETVVGVADARTTLAGAAACYFGAEDYTADLGGVRTAGNAEVAVPRAMVAQAARLARIPAFDMVTIDLGDLYRFRREAIEARALGYAGKLCVHPGQVAVAEEAFAPTVEEQAWARRVLAEFNKADGATIAVEGQMIDDVVARQARAILRAT